MKRTILILSAMLIVSVAAFIEAYQKSKELTKDVQRLRKDMEIISEPITYVKVNDSILTAKHEALQVKYAELKKMRIADTKLIKQLNIRLKDTKVIQVTKSATIDTVYLQPSGDKQDTTFIYTDKWIDLSVNIPQRRCVYKSTDSLTTIVSRTYKHKFLWWRWGTKGYQVHIVNHNPHSKVCYSKYIKIEP